ncbi:amidohydrolase family protein [Usitatibacter palustris]|uniref:amidohydrolase family protein n=1 Tax=Usitatibacter palustris TaxID=2732487 RepID=UPI001489EAED|nr:amidohydrolase family protein [Usitatibacter palustris]
MRALHATLALLAFLCSACSTMTDRCVTPTLAIIGATVYPSPTEAPIADGVVLIHGDKIVAVGTAAAISVCADVPTIRAQGQHLVAGFQNSHIHFTEPIWEGAASQPAAKLGEQLNDIALRRGFTTVVDIGSHTANTVAMRARIERGEVVGPRILTTGIPFYPVNGIPWYLRDLPPEILKMFNTPATPAEARALVAKQVAEGADAVKLFTGSGMGQGKVLPMDTAIATAAADEAHKLGKPVFSHASNLAGLEVAIAARVDVIAHPLQDTDDWSPAVNARMRERGMAMVPTLTLFGSVDNIAAIEREVGDYARAGGQILFGTDGGFIPYRGTDEEFLRMGRAGLDWRAILASLTTAPAARFGESARRGRIAPGMDADLVLLSGDPSRDTGNFSNVRMTIRRGVIAFGR